MTAPLAYPFPTRPEPGETIEVAPGVHWLRMGLPFALNHINLWLLEDGPGWTIVDTGLWSDETLASWERIFAERLDGRPVTRIIVTHFHPDHSGLAGILAERWGVELWMSRAEYYQARLQRLDVDQGMTDHQCEFYRRAGCTAEYVEHVQGRAAFFPTRVSPMPRSYRRIVDGDVIAIGGRQWHVVVGTGHAPEHACLHSPELGVMISGDQVLPRISPIVAVHPSEPEGNPLADFLGSLGKLKAIPADTLVLPSHNEPFTGLHRRLDDLRQHHDDRLDELATALDRPKTAMEVASVLFKRPLDIHQTGFAVGETLAHLHLLMDRGRIRRTLDGDGLLRYAQV